MGPPPSSQWSGLPHLPFYQPLDLRQVFPVTANDMNASQFTAPPPTQLIGHWPLESISLKLAPHFLGISPLPLWAVWANMALANEHREYPWMSKEECSTVWDKPAAFCASLSPQTPRIGGGGPGLGRCGAPPQPGASLWPAGICRVATGLYLPCQLKVY